MGARRELVGDYIKPIKFHCENQFEPAELADSDTSGRIHERPVALLQHKSDSSLTTLMGRDLILGQLGRVFQTQ